MTSLDHVFWGILERISSILVGLSICSTNFYNKIYSATLSTLVLLNHVYTLFHMVVSTLERPPGVTAVSKLVTIDNLSLESL
jgi:hypothetical protein